MDKMGIRLKETTRKLRGSGESTLSCSRNALLDSLVIKVWQASFLDLHYISTGYFINFFSSFVIGFDAFIPGPKIHVSPSDISPYIFRIQFGQLLETFIALRNISKAEIGLGDGSFHIMQCHIARFREQGAKLVAICDSFLEIRGIYMSRVSKFHFKIQDPIGDIFTYSTSFHCFGSDNLELACTRRNNPPFLASRALFPQLAQFSIFITNMRPFTPLEDKPSSRVIRNKWGSCFVLDP